jgi:hypothetical protein
MESVATPLLGRDNVNSLRALASFLAEPGQTSPAITPVAQAALQGDRDAFEWLRGEFESISGDDETLWWVEPYRTLDDITRETVVIAIGPASGTSDDATRFFCIENGTVHATELEDNPEQIEVKRTLILAWKLVPQLKNKGADWDIRARQAAKANVLANQARASDDTTRRIVLILVQDDAPSWPALLAAYMALDLDPAAPIGQAIGATRPS